MTQMGKDHDYGNGVVANHLLAVTRVVTRPRDYWLLMVARQPSIFLEAFHPHFKEFSPTGVEKEPTILP